MRALERVAGGLALVAGIVHGGLGPEHFREWWGYGVFFAAAAAAQAVLGLALLLDALDASRGLEALRRAKRALFVAGIAGNALLMAMYVVSRTSGIPFFGPAAGGVEEVDAIGVATQLVELAVIAILAWLLRGLGLRAPRPA